MGVHPELLAWEASNELARLFLMVVISTIEVEQKDFK